MRHTSHALQWFGKSRNENLYYVMSPRIPLSPVTPGKLRKFTFIFHFTFSRVAVWGLKDIICKIHKVKVKVQKDIKKTN